MNLEQTVPDEIAFPEKDLAGRMVVLGFLAQNLAIGLTFGVYGAFVKPFADSFAITRGVAASGLAIITLVLGLASPWVGGLLHRRSIRDVMTAGAACMVLGFGLLVVAPTAWVVLLLCAVLGLGATLLGPLPAMALMTNWFDAGRGRAIGIVMIPFGVMLMPIVTTLMIEAVGWRLMFGSLALLLCALTPLLRLIRNGPRDHGAGSSADRPAVHGEADSNRAVQRRLLTDTHFWMIAVTSALILAAGTAIVTHLLAYATESNQRAPPSCLPYPVEWVCSARFSSAGSATVSAARPRWRSTPPPKRCSGCSSGTEVPSGSSWRPRP